MRGASMPTSGVFATKADAAAAGTQMRASSQRSLRRPDEPRARSVRGVSAPVTSAAAASTYSAAMVMGAGLANPAKASRSSTTSNT
jgi:hypothetical protein